MFQMWGKLVENNHILQDLTVCIDDEDTRTHKVFRALDEICDAWNLAKPIWLDTNISEFKRRSKTRFTQDNFIESLEFAYSARTAHPFQRNGAPFRFKLSKAQQVD